MGGVTEKVPKNIFGKWIGGVQKHLFEELFIPTAFLCQEYKSCNSDSSSQGEFFREHPYSFTKTYEPNKKTTKSDSILSQDLGWPVPQETANKED